MERVSRHLWFYLFLLAVLNLYISLLLCVYPLLIIHSCSLILSSLVCFPSNSLSFYSFVKGLIKIKFFRWEQWSLWVPQLAIKSNLFLWDLKIKGYHYSSAPFSFLVFMPMWSVWWICYVWFDHMESFDVCLIKKKKLWCVSLAANLLLLSFYLDLKVTELSIHYILLCLQVLWSYSKT